MFSVCFENQVPASSTGVHFCEDAMRKVGNFSHVGNFTGYMQRAYDLVSRYGEGQRILDLPAGNGLLSEKLRQDGHEVVSADINRERPDFVYANMRDDLPFSAGEFDTVVCLEGLEHLLDPLFAIRELCRICRKGGHIVVSIPNIQSCYSRLHFLCKGYFYQFPPYVPVPASVRKETDLGHVSPLDLRHIESFFSSCGANLVSVTGDRWKGWHLMPLYLLFLFSGSLWIGIQNGFDKGKWDRVSRGLFNLFRPSTLFSRSIILLFQRQQ
jgi:SAM-dependent methyltransferase